MCVAYTGIIDDKFVDNRNEPAERLTCDYELIAAVLCGLEHRCNKRFLRFFYSGHVFYVFNVFFIFQRFLFKKSCQMQSINM